MTVQTINATIKNEDDTTSTHEVTYDFGETLDEAVKLFGEEVVFGRFKSAVIVDLQAVIRRLTSSKEPKVGKALQAEIDSWKPGVAKVRKSKTEKAMDLVADMDPEEIAQFLKEIKKDKAA